MAYGIDYGCALALIDVTEQLMKMKKLNYLIFGMRNKIGNGYGVCSLLLILICIATSSHAKLPPMTEVELERLANVIVQGTVLSTKTVSEAQLDVCTARTEMISTLKILKRIKSPVPLNVSKLNLHYSYDYQNACRDHPQKPGGRRDFYYSRGDKGTFYLWCNASMTTCSPFGRRD